MHLCKNLLHVMTVFCLASCGGGGASGEAGNSQNTGSNQNFQYGSGIDLPLLNATSSFEDTEYAASGTLAAVNASELFARGGTGDGITVAVIDTGIDLDHPEFTGRILPTSTYINTLNFADVEDAWFHGTMVTGLVAAARNGSGVQGTAYEADILAIRADRPGSCPSDCRFSQSDLAVATNYAVNNGSSVINYSLGSATNISSSLNTALQNAAQNNNVLVFAAGNDGLSSPSYPGMFATSQGALDRAIIVGSVDQNNQLSSFSNKAGSALGVYLVAPGEDVISTYPDGTLRQSSGTSFSTGVVSGAAASLWDAAPSLSADQIVDLLFRTATDLGEPGVDAVYGWGLLNLQAALSPQGVLAVPVTPDVHGAAIPVSESSINLAPQFGLKSAPSIQSLALDSYQRPYAVRFNNISADQYSLVPEKLTFTQKVLTKSHDRWDALQIGKTQDRHEVHLSLNEDLSLNFTHDRHKTGNFRGLNITLPEQLEGYHVSKLDRLGGHGVFNFHNKLNGNAYWNISISADASLSDANLLVPEKKLSASFEIASYATRFGGVSLKSGLLHDEEGPFGTESEGSLDIGDGYLTGFSSVYWDKKLPYNTGIWLRGEVAQTSKVRQQSNQIENFTSTAFDAGIVKNGLLRKNDQAYASFSQPLFAENAKLRLRTPSARDLKGNVYYQTSRYDLKGERPFFLEAGYGRDLDASSKYSLHLKSQLDEDKMLGETKEWIALIRFSRAFH